MPRPDRLTVADVAPIAAYMTRQFWRDVGEENPNPTNDPGSYTTIQVDLRDLDADGKFMARAAMEAWAQVTDLTFVELPADAIILDGSHAPGIRFTDNGSSATTAFEWSNNDFSGRTSTATINIGQGWLDKYGTGIGSYSFQGYLHEIGHALGLGHTGNYNTTVPAWRDRPGFDRDSFQTSVMSYYGQNLNPNDDGATRAAVITPQMADILAIRALYGVANNPFGIDDGTATDTVWGHGSNLDGYLGDYFRTYYKEGKVQPYAVTFTIRDLDGHDRLDLSHHGQDQVIDLAPGGVSSAFNHKGNIIIDTGTWIEDVAAGRGHDQIWGNSQGNSITGNKGRDRIWGDDGHDRIDGGEASDQIWGEAGNDTITGGLGSDKLYGGDDEDWLSGGDAADRLWGDAGYDLLDGGAGTDKLYGGAGDDSLTGGEGADQLDGGAGSDTLNGGASADRMNGGAGADDFLFDGAAIGADVITGFDVTEDRLHIAQSLDADLDLAGQMSVVNGNTLIRLPGFGSITLKGLTDIDAVLDRIEFV
jgi:serralysin